MNNEHIELEEINIAKNLDIVRSSSGWNCNTKTDSVSSVFELKTFSTATKVNKKRKSGHAETNIWIKFPFFNSRSMIKIWNEFTVKKLSNLQQFIKLDRKLFNTLFINHRITKSKTIRIYECEIFRKLLTIKGNLLIIICQFDNIEKNNFCHIC